MRFLIVGCYPESLCIGQLDVYIVSEKLAAVLDLPHLPFVFAFLFSSMP